MSNTTTTTGQFVEITGLDATWNLATDMAGFSDSGLRVKSIQFKPSAANDIMVVRNKTATGAKIFDVKCIDATDQRIVYFDGPNGSGAQMWPYILVTDLTLSVAASAAVKIELA